MESSIPLSEYASNEHVKQRYLQKISSIGVDPALIEGRLTLRTRQPANKLWKQASTRNNSLQAYNKMVSGFIASVQGHILADKFVVLAKVRHYIL